MPPSPPPIPEGFGPHFRRSRVTDPWEPLLSRVTPEAVQIGLVLSEAHCNSRGFVHGAVIAALADNAMGLSYLHVLRAGRPEAAPGGAVTLSLSVDYAATARAGQWLQVSPRVIRAGGGVGFVDALVTADDGVAARASAVFRAV